ncbi:MAG: pilus assembly protein CpaE, partial [Rhizomicrobium sp.]
GWVITMVNRQNVGKSEAQAAMPGQRMVPRISIHGFCEDPATGAALQKAGSDRRLAKAHIGVQLGGIAAAIEYYSGQVTPNLLIIETRLSGDAALAELDRLANVCDPLTKVVVVGHTNDVPLYRALMQRGASEYLLAPVDPLQLIDVIANLYVKPDAKPIGRVIAFIGARGGAGASSLAHNIGWCMAEELRIGTMLIDFDLAFGTVGLDFNDDPGQGVQDALQAPERLDDVLLERLLTKHGTYLTLFTAPVLLDRELGGGIDAYEAVLDAARRSSPCVILDLPSIWDEKIKALLIGADDIIVVTTPDLAALRNAKNIVEYLRLNRPNDPLPQLVLNQVGMPKRPEIHVKDYSETIGYEPVQTVPFDAQGFGVSANNGQMMAEMGQKGPAVDALRAMAHRLCGRKVPEAPATPVEVTSSKLKAFWKGIVQG